MQTGRSENSPSSGEGVASSVSMVGCTTVSVSYLAYARVLAASWRRHHPDSPFVVLLLDGDEGVHEQGNFETIAPVQLGLDDAEVGVRRGMYGPLEIATSLKPHLLMTLLERGYDAAVFVDPDTCLYGPIDDVGVAATEHGVALCPHVLDPIPADGCSPTEIEIQDTGVFNTGLIAVGKRGEDFLGWWAERLRRDCVIDSSAGLFVDQRWVDWVPSYFSHFVLRDPSLNVAYWNLHERALSSDESGPTVTGDRALRHFHFSGFEPRNPGVLTTYELHYPNPLRVRGGVAVEQLCRDYAARLLAADHEQLSRREYHFNYGASGQRVGKARREAYRQAVIETERRGSALPPSPLESASGEDVPAASRGAVVRTVRRCAHWTRRATEQVDSSDRRPPPTLRGMVMFRARRIVRHARERAHRGSRRP